LEVTDLTENPPIAVSDGKWYYFVD
jgi:hypothetical protein